MVANGLHELVLSHDVVETNGTGTSGDVLLGQEFAAEINELVNDR